MNSRRGLALAALLVVALAVTPSAGTERFLRGVHQGRAYSLYLPTSATPARPLVVALHGCAQTPEDFALVTRMNRAAARRGVGVLYPAQSAFANPARCWNWFDFSRGGEVDEVHRLVLETWLVRGMGHAWSGGDARGSHTFPPGPDATEAMLRFLADL